VVRPDLKVVFLPEGSENDKVNITKDTGQIPENVHHPENPGNNDYL
jgi:hypothetical protein